MEIESAKKESSFMNRKSKLVCFIIMTLFIFISYKESQAKTDDVIYFKDKNLEKALCEAYGCEKPITKEKAHELSKLRDYISINDGNISDLEGLQYFDGLSRIYLYGNRLSNLKPLSKLTNLTVINISNNSIKGRDFETILNNMGKISKLEDFTCTNNEIEDISFLKKIGNISNYTSLDLSNNKINDISLLKDSKNLYSLDLNNNRIKDITSLVNLMNASLEYLFLYDNCIIDMKPIKSLFDDIFSGSCGLVDMDRYDFYKNPVDIIFKNKAIQFPYITVYYQLQGYAEAITLIEALGGSADYNKETGVLTFIFHENEYVMSDFSNFYTLNGTKKYFRYEMRRMQYDLAYVSVKELSDIIGLNCKVLKDRKLNTGDGSYQIIPEVLEISEYELSDHTGDFRYKITDGLVSIIKYFGTDSNVIVPSQINELPVTSIADGAFSDDKNLVSVEIPGTVTNIGTRWGEEGAFSNCDNLVSVILNEGKEDASIGSNAFINCKKLSSIRIPENYKIIYNNAFRNCTSLKSVMISEGVERIGAGAFANNTSLSAVLIPSSMKAIGFEYDEYNTIDPYYINTTGAFAYCSSLAQVDIIEGKTESFIGVNTFYECTSLESIRIPGNYKAIYMNAFTNCTNLRKIIYEKSKLQDYAYQIIDDNAFKGCSSIEEVSLTESLRIIGNEAFMYCTNLVDIIIPEGVTDIGIGAFINNTALSSIVIPSTVIIIGQSDKGFYTGSTFEGCTNLTNVLLKEGKQKSIIGDSTFKGCAKLEKIIIPGNYISIGEEAFADCTALKTVIYKNNFSSKIKQEILIYAFKGCDSLISVSLPSTLTLLDDFVFEDCTKLKIVTIPTGVNNLKIKSFVFKNCNSLNSVYIGKNASCEIYAFSYCNPQAIIYTYSKTVKKVAEDEGLKVYEPASEEKITDNSEQEEPKSDKPKGTNNEASNTIQYNGYYYNFDETEKMVNLIKFFSDGKVIEVSIGLEDVREFTDINLRKKLFYYTEQWFNYDYNASFGEYKINNGKVYFTIQCYGFDGFNSDIMYGEVEYSGLIMESGLELDIFSHINGYREVVVYAFLQI